MRIDGTCRTIASLTREASSRNKGAGVRRGSRQATDRSIGTCYRAQVQLEQPGRRGHRSICGSQSRGGHRIQARRLAGRSDRPWALRLAPTPACVFGPQHGGAWHPRGGCLRLRRRCRDARMALGAKSTAPNNRRLPERECAARMLRPLFWNKDDRTMRDASGPIHLSAYGYWWSRAHGERR